MCDGAVNGSVVGGGYDDEGEVDGGVGQGPATSLLFFRAVTGHQPLECNLLHKKILKPMLLE